jgi:hypothetical protein
MEHTTYFFWPFNERDISTLDDFLGFYTHKAICFGALSSGTLKWNTSGFLPLHASWGVLESRTLVWHQFLMYTTVVATPLWAKCEGEAHTPKSGNLESSGTPKNSELELKAQNTSHWGVLGVIGKFLKFKWSWIGHLDICSPSYGQKKGRKSNWQFDSRPLKVGNRPLPDVCSKSATWRWKALEESYNFRSNLVPIRARGEKLWTPKIPGV